jgi:hypothetical protein
VLLKAAQIADAARLGRRARDLARQDPAFKGTTLTVDVDPASVR